MKFLLAAICALSLNFLSINATKKEDLERAAELAVERAAERVAERAVEKALEAGNSTTTTVTVREGYSNARKVAEEQAAPGSQSTRYKQQNPHYPIEYSAEYNSGQTNYADYESSEGDNKRNTPPNGEMDFDWQEEEQQPHEGQKYGEKEITQTKIMQNKTNDYQDDEPIEEHEQVEEHEQAEEELYAEENDEETSHENRAFKAYSDWEINFKKPAKENFSGKSFWSAEDSFFWDMDDAETRYNGKQRIKNVTISEPLTGESENRLWKNENFPEKNFFSWSVNNKYAVPTQHPVNRELEEKNIKTESVKERFQFPEFWATEKDHVIIDNNKKRKKLAESSEWKETSNSKNIWKNSEDFQIGSLSDSDPSDKDFWGSQDHDKSDSWVDKENSATYEKPNKEEANFWKQIEDITEDNKKMKDFLESDSWESKQLSEESQKKVKSSSTLNSDGGAEITNEDFGLYSTLWKNTNLNSNIEKSQEFESPTAISKRSTIHNDRRNYFFNNETYPITSESYEQEKTPVLKVKEKRNEKSIPSTNYPIPYLNVSSGNDPRVYRIYTTNQDALKAQIVPKKTVTKKRPKLQPVPRDVYSGYILSAYKPYSDVYDYHLKQLHNPNQVNVYRIKKQLPLYYQRAQYPQVYNPYKIQIVRAQGNKVSKPWQL